MATESGSDVEQDHSDSETDHDALEGQVHQDITIYKPCGATIIVMNTACYGLSIPSESRQLEVLQQNKWHPILLLDI